MGNMDTCVPRHITHLGYVVWRFARTVCRGEHSECMSWVYVVENMTYVVGIVCRVKTNTFGRGFVGWLCWYARCGLASVVRSTREDIEMVIEIGNRRSSFYLKVYINS